MKLAKATFTRAKSDKAREKVQETVFPEIFPENRIQAKRPSTSENKRNPEKVCLVKALW